MACSIGNVEKVKKLIEKEGCDPMKADLNGLFPLHHAVISNKIECVIVLLSSYNCNPNVSDLDRMTPLHHASYLGFSDIVKVLIEHPDIDLVCFENKPNKFNTRTKVLI